jgi:hypothetical protein
VFGKVLNVMMVQDVFILVLNMLVHVIVFEYEEEFED